MQQVANFINGQKDKVQLHIDSGVKARVKKQALDISTVLQHTADDRHLYICGPNDFMDFIIDSARNNGWQSQCMHWDRFGAEVNTDGAAFTVVAQNSGKRFAVALVLDI